MLVFKLAVSIMKLRYEKTLPRRIKYRDCKKCSNEHFKNPLKENLANNTELVFNSFEEIVLILLPSQAPFKNNGPGNSKDIYEYKNTQSYNIKV